MKLLVLRQDRLGDVLLALPSLVLLRKSCAQAEIFVDIPKSLQTLLEPFFKAWQLEFFQNRSNFDGALCLFCTPQLWMLRIPIRVGNYSKLISWVFYTAGLRQHRSAGIINEAQYNLELTRLFIKKLGADPVTDLSSIELPPAPALAPSLGNTEYLVIHPGMGGSALNLSASQYIEIIRHLQQELSLEIGISVGPAEKDQQIAKSIRTACSDVHVFENLSLPALSEVFRKARLVIAPSTGPIHLAHLVGTPVIGLYSPMTSHHPRRWSPFGGKAPVHIIVPELKGSPESVMDAVNWAKEIMARAKVILS